MSADRKAVELTMYQRTEGEVVYGNNDTAADVGLLAADVEALRTAVLQSIARALESNQANQSIVPEFDAQRGVEFYEEVAKFEVALIHEALRCTNGNQRAAARLLGM